MDDPLFFVIIMTFTFWLISYWASFTLVRNQNYLEAVLPAAIGILGHVAQDIGDLQGAAERPGNAIRRLGGIAEGAHRQPPDRDIRRSQ